MGLGIYLFKRFAIFIVILKFGNRALVKHVPFESLLFDEYFPFRTVLPLKANIECVIKTYLCLFYLLGLHLFGRLSTLVMILVF